MTTRSLAAPRIAVSSPPAAKTAKPKQKASVKSDGCIILGSLKEFQRDPLKFVMNLKRDYGDVAGFRFGNLRFFLVSDPEGIQHVLTANAANYRKPDRYETLKAVLGDGLLTSEGDFWKRQRRIIQPIFHRDRLTGFAKTMADATAAMLANWETFVESGEPVNIAAEMMKLTLRIAGLTMFSVDLLGEADELGKAVTVAIERANSGFQSLFLIPTFIPTAANRHFLKAKKKLDDIVIGMISERRKSGKDTGDLLSMLLAARDAETGEGMSDKQLRDEVMTILLAGHETTANALAWTFYLLSKNPQAARQVRAEAVSALGSRNPTPEDLPKLNYAMMASQEAMRLYPPAWSFGRQAIAADEIGGVPIRKGAGIFIAPYVVHRNSNYWDNPEGFDPDRFTTERVKARHKMAYIPFAAGSRKCIGADFALMELAIVVPMVVRRYRLSLVPGFEVVPEPTVTLRPRDGLQMTIAAADAPKGN